MNRDIFNDANYLIIIFNEDNIDISCRKVILLMLLVEAYYISKHNKASLYDCDYYNFDQGPVALRLKKSLEKKYGEDCNIILSQEEKDDISEIPNDIKEAIMEIYTRFGKYNADQIKDIMYSKFFPAEEFDMYDIILKSYIKKWFKYHLM